MDTLRLVTDVSSEVEAVLNVMNKLADDVGRYHFFLSFCLLSRLISEINIFFKSTTITIDISQFGLLGGLKLA